MKKQNIFLILIGIILYISYLIITFSYKEYKINSHIEYITKLNQEIRESIATTNNLIDYKSSRAYKNKILKEQQSQKNKGEMVVYLTSEKKFNKYTQKNVVSEQTIQTLSENKNPDTMDNLRIYDKWMHLLFNKK